MYYNWDFLTGKNEYNGKSSYCGLHGRTQVDPDGDQVNLDHRGGCGYRRREPVQLKLKFDF